MLKSYLKIALRNLLRQKGYAFINVTGLTVGLTCCLLISLYVWHERSYDRFHRHADRIYRVVEDITRPDGTVARAPAAGAVGPALVRDFPEVLRAVRFERATMLIAHGERRFQEDNVYFTDSTVFDVFSFPLLKGDPHTALTAPFSIVLTSGAAQRYFGEADPIGQTLIIGSKTPFTVTGVLQDPPPNSHIRFDMLLSMATREAFSPGWSGGWFWSAYTYVLLAPGYDRAGLEEKLPQFIERYMGDEMRETGQQHALSLQLLRDIHLYSKRAGEPSPPGSLSNLYLFSMIAVLILLIACVNFVNLTTAQAARRAKEVGLRRVVGGTQTQLVLQFLTEPVLLSLGASVLAFASGYLLLPVFRALAGTPVTMAMFASPWAVAAFLNVALGVGCLAGSYPAFVLSRFRPASVLKGTLNVTSGGGLLRKGLIVFQFSISVALIAGTVTVFSQLRYMQQQDLGFDHEQVLVLYFGDDGRVQQQVEAIKQELLRSPGVRGAAASSYIPGKEPGMIQTEIETASGAMQAADMHLLSVDYDFTPLYDIELTAGRAFSRLHGSDSTGALMINETAARQFGFQNPEAVIGKRFSQGGFQHRTGTVIGVVKDFHYASLHKRIEPLAIRMRPHSLSYLSLRIRSEALGATMDDLERRWRSLAPHRPFDYFFLDEQFDQQYRADRQFGQVFGAFATIAIILACLGLFGLAAFTAERRTKEVGVRKVFGASVGQIVVLLSREMLTPVGIAVLAAVPVTYLTMQRWLEGFAYRVELSGWRFFIVGLSALLIALITVSYRAVKAATANPAQTLRNE